MRGGGTPEEEVVSVQVVVVDAMVDVICCVVASGVDVIWTVAEASVDEVEIFVVLVLVEGTSPFSSFLISKTARVAVELRRLNFRTLRDKNKGFRMPEIWKDIKTERCS